MSTNNENHLDRYIGIANKSDVNVGITNDPGNGFKLPPLGQAKKKKKKKDRQRRQS